MGVNFPGLMGISRFDTVLGFGLDAFVLVFVFTRADWIKSFSVDDPKTFDIVYKKLSAS